MREDKNQTIHDVKGMSDIMDVIFKYGQLIGICIIAWLQTQFPSRAAFDELSKKLDSLQNQVTMLGATQQKVSEISVKINEFDTRIRFLEIGMAKTQSVRSDK